MQGQQHQKMQHLMEWVSTQQQQQHQSEFQAKMMQAMLGMFQLLIPTQ